MRGAIRATSLALVAVALLQAQTTGPPAPQTTSARRVILLSVDGGADWIVDRLIEQGRAPAFRALAEQGARAEAMIGAMPSVTATAHATLWTGAWPRAHGVAGNSVSRLPRAAHTVLESQSGFGSAALVAEPLWFSAARAGRRVLVLQATAGFPFTSASDRLLQFDVYENRLVPEGWFENTLVNGEFRFTVGDTACMLRAGDSDGLRLRVGDREARLTPGRGGRFTPPLPIRAEEREAAVRFRLVDYDRTTGAFRLAHGIAAEITSSDPDWLPAFRATAGAIIGEGYVDDYRAGRFGPTIASGGDGGAERWLGEFLAANQEYFSGSVAFAAKHPWDLLVVYIPNFDAAAHALVGVLDPLSHRYDPTLAARAWPLLADLFEQNVDTFVADLRRRFPDATLVVTADHGMEGAGRLVRPNIALARAGLLAADSAGRIDLTRTRAVFQSSRGNMVFVNSTRWHMGVVPDEEVAAVKRSVSATLLGIRDPSTGAAPIRAVFDPDVDGEALGLGGPAGGDVYFDPSPGYYPQGTIAGDDLVVDTGNMGQGVHGAAPWRRNLQAILYVVGPGIPRGARLGVFDAVDVAPTVAALVGAPPPKQAIGRAITDVLR